MLFHQRWIIKCYIGTSSIMMNDYEGYFLEWQFSTFNKWMICSKFMIVNKLWRKLCGKTPLMFLESEWQTWNKSLAGTWEWWEESWTLQVKVRSQALDNGRMELWLVIQSSCGEAGKLSFEIIIHLYFILDLFLLLTKIHTGFSNFWWYIFCCSVEMIKQHHCFGSLVFTFKFLLAVHTIFLWNLWI